MSLPDSENGSANLNLSSSSKPKNKKGSSPNEFLLPCLVCNAKATGYHYGANTCEACKTFFRRSIGHEDAIKPCSKDGKCADNPNGKISCADCRHKKCLSLRMAKEGCRRGRYTYKKQTQNTREFRRLRAEENISKHFEVQQCADTASLLASQFKTSFPQVYEFLLDQEEVDVRIQEMVGEDCRVKPISRVLYSQGHSPDVTAQNWYENVNFNLQQIDCERENTILASIQSMVFDRWAFQTEKVLYGLASFVKCIPGFSDLLLEDRIILLKEGRVDSLTILKHKSLYPPLEAVALYNRDSGDLFLFSLDILRQDRGDDCVKQMIRHRHIYTDIEAAVHHDRHTGDLFLIPVLMLRQLTGDEYKDAMVCVNSKIRKLNLTLEDIAVLLAFVVLTSDREGLQRIDEVQKLQDKMLPVFQYCMQKNHPDEPNMVADTLLLLPLLRETSEINKKSLGEIRSRVKPEITPILSEILKE